MKSLRKLNRLLLIVVCTAPVLANASAFDFSNARHRGFSRSDNTQKSAKFFNAHNRSLSFLQPSANANSNLANGTYQFGQLESSFPVTFSDKWSFSLAESSQVNLTVSALNAGKNLFRITGLGLSLFDTNNNLLGSITSANSLNLLLAANTQYWFSVSGSARGIFGGAYLGALKVSPPTAVPVGYSLPMFTAALLLLGWKLRRQELLS